MEKEKKLYVPLLNLNQNPKEDECVSFVVECIKTEKESEFAVDFLADHPDKKQDILFHFNPRPPNILLLDTCKQNKWDRGVQLMDDEFNRTFFKKPFELAIKQTNRKGIGEDMSEFGVFVDRKFLTTYLCPFRITTAKYIQFSRNVRITANINTF